ncbi:MAG: hypothetical protein KR126chlam1_00052 [Chlamydiae bacterium]|nr:hypothetical protein [Chlamydiota bacterium]
MKKTSFITMICMLAALLGGQLQAENASVESKKYNLSACALFKDEAPYLREWLEYHKMLGVDHFYLYNNDSTDNYYEVLRPYIEEGVVTLVNWPTRAGKKTDEEPFLYALTTHVPAYENCSKWLSKDETKWLTFLSVDEYLLPLYASSLTALLEKYDEFPGIALSSNCYDAYSFDQFSGKSLLIESVDLTAAPKEHSMLTMEKCIFKPDQATMFHWPNYKQIFKGNCYAAQVDRSDLRVNRYVHRYKGYLDFAREKESLCIDHRLLTEKEADQILADGYQIQDHEKAIYRFLPSLRNRMGYQVAWNW